MKSYEIETMFVVIIYNLLGDFCHNSVCILLANKLILIGKIVEIFL